MVDVIRILEIMRQRTQAITGHVFVPEVADYEDAGVRYIRIRLAEREPMRLPSEMEEMVKRYAMGHKRCRGKSPRYKNHRRLART